MKNIVESKFLNSIKKHNLIEQGDIIICACSGGADSISLLHLLIGLKDNIGIEVVSAHLNHKFRGDSAIKDAEFVKQKSREWNIEHFYREVDCPDIARKTSKSSEEVGRDERYRFFYDISQELKKRGYKENQIKIAVGQNKNDQAETILFKIIRGTSLDGLKGIDYKRINAWGNIVIRPILDIKRIDIEKYCSQNVLNPRIDETNSQSIYTRNKIRLEVIPLIEEKINSGLNDALINLGKLAREDGEFITNQARLKYAECVILEEDNKISFDMNRLFQNHKSIWSRIVIWAIGKLGFKENVKIAHIESLASLIGNENGTKVIEVSKEIEIRVGYGKVELARKIKKARKELYIKLLDIDEYKHLKRDRTEIVLDFDKLAEEFSNFDPENQIVLRNREPKDFIRMKDDLGRKKVKDLFIDMKVPKSDRDFVDLVALGNEVLWIPKGLSKEKVTGKYKLDKDTKNVIILEIKDEI